MAVLLATVLGARGTLPTYALFTDPAAVRSGSLAAGTLLPPTALTCTNGPALSGYVDIGWTTTTTQARHLLEAESTPGVWVPLGTAPTGAATLRITPAMVASILSLGVTYRIRLTAVAGTSWTSAVSATTTIKTLSVLGIGLGVACA